MKNYLILTYSIVFIIIGAFLVYSAKACDCLSPCPGSESCYICFSGTWIPHPYVECYILGQAKPGSTCEYCQNCFWTINANSAYYCNGACRECCNDLQCGNCKKCIDNSCESCNCWDIYEPIEVSMSVPEECEICHILAFAGGAADVDHWVSGDGGAGWPYDSMTYSWSLSSDSNPNTGTILFGADQPTMFWQSPSKIGNINVTLSADDKPDEMQDPCDEDSTRDDSSVNDSSIISVVLPSGCEQCSETTMIQMEIIPILDHNVCNVLSVGVNGQTYEYCGLTDTPTMQGNVEIEACYSYNQGEWRFSAIQNGELRYGACLSNYSQIDYDMQVVDSENYCAIVDEFYYSPDAEAADDNGCLQGDVNYSNTACIDLHEGEHKRLFYEALYQRLESINKNPISMVIDCNDTNTITCTAAIESKRQEVQDIYNDMIEYCVQYMNNEELAEEAAMECFHSLATAICEHARDMAWSYCETCGEAGITW